MTTLAAEAYSRDRTNAAISAALDRGCTVLFGTANTLLIDFDGDGQKRYEACRPVLDSLFGIEEETRWKSSSREAGHEHLQVRLAADFTVEERIALQAILGSDPMREILSLRNRRQGSIEPCVLFRPPPQQKKTLSESFGELIA